MREVDFLPTWYKEKRRHQRRIWNQCVALAIIFLIMIIWNSLATRSIVQARADLSAKETRRVYAEYTSRQFEDYHARIASLQKQLSFFEKLDSHLDVPSVLAELSHLINDHIVLSYMHCVAEPFCQSGPTELPSAEHVTSSPDRTHRFFGDVRFRIVLGGTAMNASEIASLINNLEQSPYFRRVILVFARDANTAPETGSSDKEEAPGKSQHLRGKMEFEILCYLANYVEPEIDKPS